MSRQQYVFIVGVILVWLAWDAGWIVLAAVAVGLVGLGVVKILEGELDMSEFTERFRSSDTKRPKR